MLELTAMYTYIQSIFTFYFYVGNTGLKSSNIKIINGTIATVSI